MTNPLERRVTANGISLTVFEWGRELQGNGDTVLLAHATGFHARCWDQVVRHLGRRHVIAVDARGHGRSDKVYPVRWADFGRDLADLVRALELRDIVGVGHSMGGHAMVDAAAFESGRFRRLVLIDPVIASPEIYAALGSAEEGEVEMHPTSKRRYRWSSPDEMFERFAGSGPFVDFDRAVLRDYCQFGLLPDPEGEGFVLACPPEFEASVYMAAMRHGEVHRSALALDIPVFLIRAMERPDDGGHMDFRYSPTWPGLVGELRRGRELHLPDRTHFLPMEHPAETAKLILE